MQQEQLNQFIESLEVYEQSVIGDLLNKTGIEPAKFIQTVINELKNSPKLQDAYIKNPNSMLASILFAAEIGLIPSENLGEFFLIPRSVKQSNGQYLPTVTPLIGYKGMVSIILRSGQVSRLHAEVVYQGDEFQVTYGLEPDIKHTPNFDVSRDAKDITHVYAVAKMKNGEYSIAVITKKQIEAIRDMSKYDNDLYFNDKRNPNRWLEKKTALLQLAKLLPKDYHTKIASEYDSKFNSGATITLDDQNKVKLIEDEHSKRPQRFRSIYETMGK